jgi:5'-deoxynucleotidase
MNSNFLKLLYRSSSIKRWSGTNCVYTEDVAQHSYNVSVITYLLCTTMKIYYGIEIDINLAVTKSVFHDCTDTILTHLISPVKKNNKAMQQAVGILEENTRSQIERMLPDEMQEEFKQYVCRSSSLIDEIIEIADNIDVYCKSILELSRGNEEFRIPSEQSSSKLKEDIKNYPFIEQFVSLFLESFAKDDYSFRYLM